MRRNGKNNNHDNRINKNNNGTQPQQPPQPPHPPPPAPPVHRRKKKRRGIIGRENLFKLPTVTPNRRCRLKLLKLQRIKDWLLMEEEFLKRRQIGNNDKEDNDDDDDDEVRHSDKAIVERFRTPPLKVVTLEEIVDANHAIISFRGGAELYLPICSFIDRDQLEPNCQVLYSPTRHMIVGVLNDDFDPLAMSMIVNKAPNETYEDVGGLDRQIQEIKECIEFPLTHPEYFQDMGIKPPKGVILYGPPGTGKTLLVKAVANQTSATFLRVVGSELIQKYLGEGPKLVREMFVVAEEYAPSIIFIDEVDAFGTKRYFARDGEKEVQRTLLELLNQLDGFDSRGEVKVVMATNRIETLDPALIRPGRIDRKIEFPLPDDNAKKRIFRIHTARMTLADDVNFDELVGINEDLSGADIKAVCTEAGLLALRERRMKVTQQDFSNSKHNVFVRKSHDLSASCYL